VAYGAETWTMMKKEEQALLAFERKIIRGIYSLKYKNGKWKTRTNRELEEVSKGENIVKWIKGQRISCLGHLERMEENRMPRKGWKKEVESDLQVLGVRRWREFVTGKNGRILFNRPKPTAGCSARGSKCSE
jgi:hypothetical protein